MSLYLLPIHQKRIEFCNLGSAKCSIRIYQNKYAIAKLIALHGNENTCIAASLALPHSSSPFALYELMQNGSRLLKYIYNNKNYYFDPNRIFSKKGIIKTLKKYNKSYPLKLITKIKSFADAVLKIVAIKSSSKYIIAIHNNTDDHFSVNSYKNTANASMIYMSKSQDPDDFFLVTKESDFTFFKAQKQNVVLQSKYAKDDGSLSIYCQTHKVPYINVEAQIRHKKKQIDMLLLCKRLLTKSH
ncbi:MAG: hypothetical protein KKE39_14325 [Bacteroidetes bacterium]|nr:hypothetical protein [Bacteroidota bacterium]MBU1371445.1 hypothetical protein [Bacteroidota bacterium]MBU1484011.1 hypothetical protein [Bacteroidota bacterium]MBU1759869.1 hypothetical protein [Bacteroidota bacterium]MBU2045537.1 hypothetical protein [Bacteroidota bacterium]